MHICLPLSFWGPPRGWGETLGITGNPLIRYPFFSFDLAGGWLFVQVPAQRRGLH